jgi:predicted ATPase
MINLRQARFDDHWRRALRRDYQLVVKELEFSEGEIFGSVSLSLKPGINAIVGKNGIGKSNFIRAIYNSLRSEQSNREKFSHLLDESRIKFKLILEGYELSLDLNPLETNIIEHDILCLLFDPCSLIPEIQKLFAQQENLGELLESFSSIFLSEDDLRLANFIANTEYTSVEIINLEEEFDAFPILPFFVVERKDVKYDSRHMGLGELSLLYYFWIVDYVRKSHKKCFLIIEEPESFLPPLIQNRLSDVLAMMLDTKGITCLVSTHSEHILKKIPRSHVHVMCRVKDRIEFFNAATHFESMSVLGLNAPKKGLVFYEDQAGYLFARALLKKSSAFVMDSFYYHRSGSDGDVLRDIKRFPRFLSDFSFVAVFDGDCRGRLDNQLEGFTNYVFLPSSVSPEEHLISYLKTLDHTTIANYLGKKVEVISASIDVVAGLDHHDYFLAMGRVLSLPYDELFASLCDLWISDDANIESVTRFLSDFEGNIK